MINALTGLCLGRLTVSEKCARFKPKNNMRHRISKSCTWRFNVKKGIIPLPGIPIADASRRCRADRFIGRAYIRKQLEDNLMTFGVPYNRYVEMEANVTGSFLEHPVWQTLRKLKT